MVGIARSWIWQVESSIGEVTRQVQDPGLRPVAIAEKLAERGDVDTGHACFPTQPVASRPARLAPRH